MTANNYSPTLANILSSLKIKGASVTGGSGKSGFVPVLGPNGKLDTSTIPIDSISGMLEVPILNDIAVVDSTADASAATGSIAAPFKTLLAASQAGFKNFLLIGGNYGDDSATLSNTVTKIRIFSIGTSTFDTLTFSRYANGAFFELYNVIASTKMEFTSSSQCSVSLLGNGLTGKVSAPESIDLRLFIDPTYRVDSLEGDYITVTYLAKGSRVENDSVKVPGDTVTDAIDSLSDRKVRIPNFTSDANGLHAPTYTDVSVTSLINTYELQSFGIALANAINSIFHKDGDSPIYVDVTADNMTVTNNITSRSVKTNELKLSVSGVEKAVVKIDADNFLIIA